MRGSSVALMCAEFGEGDEFVEHHARAEQIADRGGIVPGNADEPGDRREDPAENLAAGCTETSDDVHVHPAHACR